MDRSRCRSVGRRSPGRTLVGLVVLAAALYSGLALGGHLDTAAPSDAIGSVARHAAVHEHTATVRALLPTRGDDRVAKSGLRETFALAAAALTVALAFAARRRLRAGTQQLLPSYIRFGAPRAPPLLQLQP